MTGHTILLELALIIGLAAVLALIGRAIKQPTIIAYLVVGILVGPFAFDLLQSTEVVQTFARIGVAFLLFIVGLNLDFRVLKGIGGIALFLFMEFVYGPDVINFVLTIPNYGYVTIPVENLGIFTQILILTVGIVLIVIYVVLSGTTLQTSGLWIKLKHFREHGQIKDELKKMDKTLEDLKEFKQH